MKISVEFQSYMFKKKLTQTGAGAKKGDLNNWGVESPFYKRR